jgi:DNA polymerase-1
MSSKDEQERPTATALFPKGADDVLVLVDLSAFVFRAYHALMPLSSPSGEPTHAVYGTVTMLERLITQFQPKMLAFALDSGRATFRQKLYPKYKANRPEPPEDLVVQLVRVTTIVSAMSHLVWQCPGFEADDIIATTVRQAREQGLRVLIVGADKDLMQLVGGDVILWDPSRDKIVGPPEVQEKLGVNVSQVGDWLSLTGDSSDNIPGVPGIGPKTACELLRAYGDLDGIYAHLGEIARKKVREQLSEHQALAYLSRQLVTLHDDCGAQLDKAKLVWQGRDTERLRVLYDELGFQKLLTALGPRSSTLTKTSEDSPSIAAPRTTIEVAAGYEAYWVESESSLAELLSAAEKQPSVALMLHRVDDTQTRSPWAWLSVAHGLHESHVVPLVPSLLGGPQPLRQELVASRLAEFARRHSSKIATHGSRRLWLALQAENIDEFSLDMDTELASYLLDPQADHELMQVSGRVLGPDSPFAKSPTSTRGSEDLDARKRTLASEVQAIFRTAHLLQDRLSGEGLTKLMAEIELPLSRTLARMQRHGVAVDCSHLATLGSHMRGELARLEAEAHRVAGRAFNMQSPRQLETILFDELGLKPLRRTKTTRSTDAKTLEALIDEHPLVPLVLEHRHIAKLEGTYVHTLPTLVDTQSGRLHTSWEQTSTATGRISSVDPNLQNIPIRSELGRSIRQSFVAPPGHVLMSSDYSQIELRVLAHLSQDPLLLESFQSGTDVHQRTAMAVFGVPAESVTPEMRRRAKAVNFGVIYGQTDAGLARALSIPRAEASSFIATYFQRHEGVRRYMNELLARAREGQAVYSLMGRRRLLPQISSSNRSVRLAAERMAMNMPIQGTAADLLKVAMLRLDKPPSKGSKMVLTVHDELVFEVPEDERAEAQEVLRDAMQSVATLAVPLVVEIGVGRNWMQAHDSGG